MKYYVLIFILFLVAGLLAFLLPKNSDYIKNGKLYISEFMSSNTYTIKDDDNEYSDYIEIYNGYSNSINLENFMLSDTEYKTDKWVFPEIEIKSGEYLIVYASSKNKCDIEKRICHTNFKLSSEGEVITLTDPNNNILSKVWYQKASNDIAIGYSNGKYIKMANPTPGQRNSNEKIGNVDVSKYKLIFNEYMTKNKRINYLPSGGYFDWVEIYNDTDSDLSLNGLYLSDDAKKLNKYKFPNVEVKAKSYLVVYLTGDIQVDNYVCANFKLSNNDNELILSNNEDIIDRIKIVSLLDNISYGRQNGKWLYFMTPTPGYLNNTYGMESLGGNNGNT